MVEREAVNPALNFPRWMALIHDAAASALAWALAMWLRFNFDVPPEFRESLLFTTPVVVAVHAVIFWRAGLYRGLWRYTGMEDLQRILGTAAFGALAVPALLVLLGPDPHPPRSMYIISPLLLVGLLSLSRLGYRVAKEGRLTGLMRTSGAEAVLVMGAGVAGAILVRELSGSGTRRVVGLLDDDPRKQGGEIAGVKVLGPLDRVAAIARDLGATQAIIAMPGASHSARRRALDFCKAGGLRVMTVPAYGDIVSGAVKVSALREVELDDLLGRDPVQLDDAALHGFLHGKVVLVTGAGGSIGSELCRQVARYAPERIVMLDASEFALYTIEQQFDGREPEVAVTPLIGDVKDENRVRQVFERHRPQVVFHAAAYKHVPLMEQDNAFGAVANNVLGTLVVARAAEAWGAEKFVLVSTDKAVNPTNVMGASKRLAEIACQALQQAGGMQHVIVRFGNVLGSTGSVIPKFREQIARGGPVTVTHQDITRYFMSIPEAAQLVMQAALMGHSGQIFVLDMGEPVRIADLARDMIRLSGFADGDIRLVYTGLRAGEKLYEELLADAETTLPTPHSKLRIARAGTADRLGMLKEVEEWLRRPESTEAEAVRKRLRAWIPEYLPAQPAGEPRLNKGTPSIPAG